MMPFYQTGGFDYSVAMALATLLGVGFGFVLERAGFGRGDILVAQFYGTDNRVFKVMFSAIATTTIGLGLLGGIGAVDLGALVIPETFIYPAIAGGVLLGAGFVTSGYCPGTALVAAGSGHVDALYSLGGIMLGALIFGFAYPWVEGLYQSGALGVVTFPELWGISWPILAVGVLAMAVGAFILAEKGERYLSNKQQIAAPAGRASTRNRVLGGLGLVAALGLATMAVPQTVATPADPQVASIDALTLAQRLARGRADLYVVDLRAPEACAKARIPGAMCLTDDDPDGAFLATLPATRTLALYGDGDLARIPPGALAYAGPIRTVPGGYRAFEAAVIDAPAPPIDGTRADVEAYRTRAALHAHFIGASAPAAPVRARPKATKRKVKKGGGC